MLRKFYNFLLFLKVEKLRHVGLKLLGSLERVYEG